MSKQSCTQCHDKYWPQMTGTLFFGMHVSYDLFSFWKHLVWNTLATGIFEGLRGIGFIYPERILIH